jgi:hypothetical protein
VLSMATLKIGHPIKMLVLMKSDYPSLQNFSLPSRFREPYQTGAKRPASPTRTYFNMRNFTMRSTLIRAGCMPLLCHL